MTYPKITYDYTKCDQGRPMKIINDGPWWDGGVYWMHIDDSSPCDGEDCKNKLKEINQ